MKRELPARDDYYRPRRAAELRRQAAEQKQRTKQTIRTGRRSLWLAVGLLFTLLCYRWIFGDMPGPFLAIGSIAMVLAFLTGLFIFSGEVEAAVKRGHRLEDAAEALEAEHAARDGCGLCGEAP